MRADDIPDIFISSQIIDQDLAKERLVNLTGWFSTLDGVLWERDFLAGNATAAGAWEDTMDYYVLVVRGGGEPEDDKTYRVAFIASGYTEEVGEAYNIQVEEGSLSTFLRAWLEEQKTVSPDGNPWE